MIPAGTFNRSNVTTAPATVSSFRLDTYEVSVGRFRQFVAGYPGTLPAAGSGKNPADANDMGWDPAWNASLETDAAALVNLLVMRCQGSTFTRDPGANEGQPINCLTWFEAQAFCIWDQGRLPTEAEWNYAAAGGSEQRIFPWSVPPESVTVDATYAVVEGAVQVVGSRSPKGDGKWGQSDLAGNVWEWVLDYLGNYPVPCVDCANHLPSGASPSRADRGGSTYPSFTSSQILRTTNRGNVLPAQRQDNLGVRCARAP